MLYRCKVILVMCTVKWRETPPVYLLWLSPVYLDSESELLLGIYLVHITYWNIPWYLPGTRYTCGIPVTYRNKGTVAGKKSKQNRNAVLTPKRSINTRYLVGVLRTGIYFGVNAYTGGVR